MAADRNDDWRDCHECGTQYSLRQRTVDGKRVMVCIYCNPVERVVTAAPHAQPDATPVPQLEEMFT